MKFRTSLSSNITTTIEWLTNNTSKKLQSVNDSKAQGTKMIGDGWTISVDDDFYIIIDIDSNEISTLFKLNFDNLTLIK
jgi:hypothetical protein